MKVHKSWFMMVYWISKCHGNMGSVEKGRENNR